MSKVHVKVPGSCGELIQGFFGGPESLVSYAIDCYSNVTLEESPEYKLSINHTNEKASVALKKACEIFGIDHGHLKMDIESDIPIGKGMASSTADIVGVLAAVAAYAGKSPDPMWLGKTAAEIEPTDNIMFDDWVLFDHLQGEVLENLKAFGDLSVLILEMDDTVDTKALRAAGAFSKAQKPNPSKALNLLRRAVETKSLAILGEAIHLSAVENQVVLNKPYLNELIDLAKTCGMVGVNTSHSGTVLGVIYESHKRPDQFIKLAERAGYLQPYTKRYTHKIIRGGPIIEIIE